MRATNRSTSRRFSFVLTFAAALLRADSDFGLRWSWATPSGEIGRAALHAADFDGNGVEDLVLPGCGDSCWIVYTKGGSGYRQLTSSRLDGTPFQWLSVSEVPGSGTFVLAGDSFAVEVGVFAGAEPATRRIDVDGGGSLDAEVADVDADGELELVVIDSFDLRIYDFDSGVPEATKFGFGGIDLALGQIDADPQLELAVADGLEACWILDGATLAVDWGTTSGCGNTIAFGQLTPDSSQELVTDGYNSSHYRVARAFDPPQLAPLWTSDYANYGEGRIAIADLGIEPGNEVVFGTTYDSTLIVSGVDGEVLGFLESRARGGVAVGDFDSDGAPEIAFRDDSSYQNHWIVVLDASSEVEAGFPEFAIESSAIDAGDLEQDGDIELIVGALIAGEYGDREPAILQFGGSTGGGPGVRTLGQGETSYYAWVSDLDLGDLDGDPDPEICVSFAADAAYLACFDSDVQSELWTLQTSSRRGPVLLADLGADGLTDVVTARPPNSPYGFNAVTANRGDLGWLAWQTPNLWEDVAWVDRLCHGDVAGTLGEHVVAFGGSPLAFVVVDPQTGDVTKIATPDPSPTAVTCADLDGNGELELLAGAEDGVVASLDAETGAWGPPLADLESEIRAIAVGDFLGSGARQIATLSETGVQLLDASSGDLLDSLPGAFDPDFDGYFEAHELDGDDRSELVLRTWSKLHVFGRPSSSEVLLVDGFETGSTDFWSWSPL